jgi:hypothetical protein
MFIACLVVVAFVVAVGTSVQGLCDNILMRISVIY